MDYGLNLIDTAPIYESGYSEQIVGAALKGRRDGMFVIDKIDHLDQPVGPQVDASLRRSDSIRWISSSSTVSTIDGLAVASPPLGMEELARAFRPARCGSAASQSSSRRPARGDPIGLCDVVMFPVGPFVDPRYIDVILPLARSKGVGTVCFKTFGAGKLLGDTTGYNQPLQARPRGKFSSGGKESAVEPQLPRLSVADCLHYTLTLDPDVALLGLSFPNEQDAAFRAFEAFRPLEPAQLKEIEGRAAQAIEGKGKCSWNPGESGGRPVGSDCGLTAIGHVESRRVKKSKNWFCPAGIFDHTL